jgi:hypothetical protein
MILDKLGYVAQTFKLWKANGSKILFTSFSLNLKFLEVSKNKCCGTFSFMYSLIGWEMTFAVTIVCDG